MYRLLGQILRVGTACDSVQMYHVSMSCSNSASSIWRSLGDRKQADFRTQRVQLPDNITDESSFRLSFENLCRGYKEKNYVKLLVRLRLGAINSIAGELDAFEDLAPPCNLRALVLGSVFVAVSV